MTWSGIKTISLVITAIFTLLCLPAKAEDILFMPSANQVSAGLSKLSYCWIDLEPSPSGDPEDLKGYFFYTGLSDGIELSWIRLHPEGRDKEEAWNISYLYSPETPYSAAAVLGATNITGKNYRGSSATSLYVAWAATVRRQRRWGQPERPRYRYHFGYGTKLHDGFFGGVETFVTPRLLATITNYQGNPTYLASYRFPAGKAGLEIEAGYTAGDPFASLTYIYR